MVTGHEKEHDRLYVSTAKRHSMSTAGRDTDEADVPLDSTGRRRKKQKLYIVRVEQMWMPGALFSEGNDYPRNLTASNVRNKDTLLDSTRPKQKKQIVRERLEYIEMDEHEYTLDDEDRKVQTVIMNPDPSHTDTAILKKTLLCSYLNLPFKEVIKKKKEKLHVELQRSQSNYDGFTKILENMVKPTTMTLVCGITVVGSREQLKRRLQSKSLKFTAYIHIQVHRIYKGTLKMLLVLREDFTALAY